MLYNGLKKQEVPKENISFIKDSFTFKSPYTGSEFVNNFSKYYGPTIHAFEAAEKNGKALDLQHELESLFNSQNQSLDKTSRSITKSDGEALSIPGKLQVKSSTAF